MSSRRVLITGGTGFVGSNLVRRLLKDGADVHLLVRPESCNWRLIDVFDDISLHIALLDNIEDVRKLLRTVRPEEVYHLAVYGAYPLQLDFNIMLATNVSGTAHLLDACRGVDVRVFVNAGSSSEYGHKEHASSEDDCPQPNSKYAITKLAATHLCQLAATNAGFPIPTLRLYSVYGRNEDPSRLIPTLIKHARNRTLPPLVDPDVERDYVHVDDVVNAFCMVASMASNKSVFVDPARIFNVCTGRGVKMYELIARVRRLFEIEDEPAWSSMPNRVWDCKTWVGNPKRINTEIGWSARIPLEDGLRVLYESSL